MEIKTKERNFAPQNPQARLLAGRTAKRLSSWRPQITTLDTELKARGQTLLARAREMGTSNPYGSRAVGMYSGYAVRDGIRPLFETSADAAQNRLREAWDTWTEDADYDNRDDLYGLQELVARETYVAGECFVLRMSDSDRPLSLKIVPAEMLPYQSGPSGFYKLSDTRNHIINGIEYTDSGELVGYHFYKKHPGDFATTDLRKTLHETEFHPARDVIHVMDRIEAGQIRGVSRLAPGLVRLHLLDMYDDAELDRQRIAALFCGFIYRADAMDGAPTWTDGVTRDSVEDPTDGELLVDMIPGQMVDLPPGTRVEFSTPPQIQGQYAEFQKRNLQAVASAFGLPYDVLTGDMSAANYSASRKAQLDFKVSIGQFQRRIVIHQFCRGVRKWFLEAKTLRQQINMSDGNIRWTWKPPRWDWVDVAAEMKAIEGELRNGLVSRREVIESRGRSPEEVDREIEADDINQLIIETANPGEPDEPTAD